VRLGGWVTVSRLPWFTALVAWGTDGTWTSGVGFVDDRERWMLPEPAEGDPDPLRSRYGLELRRAETFAIERGRGWTETEDRLETLVDVQWADWDASGRLLVATTDGRLQVLGAEGPDSAVSWEVDLSADEPDPRPPPEEARRW
jgi:hypothetical protein